MEVALTIVEQIIKMFIMMAVGAWLYHKSIVNEDTSSRLSAILLNVATPCTIITAFNQEFSTLKLQGLILSFILAILAIILSGLIGKLFFNKNKIESFSVCFANAGFIGIPLVTGLLGSASVFYLSAYIAMFYIFLWTYGIVLMSGDKKRVNWQSILFNPTILATGLGILLFVLPIGLWTPISQAVSSLGSMNTPLAMLILGIYMAKSNLIEMFTDFKIYKACLVRLIVVGIATLMALSLVPNQYNEIKTVILIANCAPVGVIVAVFAQMFHEDYNYSAEIVSLSTILCVVTMPLLVFASQIMWGGF